MRYVVTGHHRSGTNMLFRMLVAGGIPTATKKQDIKLGSLSYHPNPKGYYEHAHGDAFPDGHIIKHNNMPHDAHMDTPCLIAIIERDPYEVYLSHCKTWGATHDMTHESYLLHYSSLEAALAEQGRPYISVNYADTVLYTRGVMQQLADFGFPIDVGKAAAEQDSALYRNRVA